MAVPPAPGPRTRVLQLVGNAIVGGTEHCVLRLLERLPRERFECTVLCPFEGEFSARLRALGIEVLPVAMPPGPPPAASVRLAATLMRRRAVDVVHSHLPNAHRLAALAGRLAGRPVLATVHSLEPDPVDLALHRGAGTHLAVVCRPSYRHALGRGAHPARLHLLPNGVDGAVFRPARSRAGPLRRRLGIPPEAPLAGFVGRLSWEKGPDLFLHAVRAARRDAPHAHFVLVGEGPMRQELQAAIERGGLADCTHLAGLQSDMPAVYAELDLLASTSRSEAMPLAVLEAMACGLPVLGIGVGALPELIVPGATGWLVEPGELPALAARLGEGLRAPHALAAMGAQARQRALGHFALEHGVRRAAALLERLAGTRSGLPGLHAPGCEARTAHPPIPAPPSPGRSAEA
ncbi:glycosyltransferase [Caldimonas tepidiphila]|uniref:glycosyltransferase n=1 Tax=Caldimonas tepidiphila TaxID=2315841 RepID=UPI000E5A6765|nr:glycosyltransferase [Caldimonas tepidiphila]